MSIAHAAHAEIRVTDLDASRDFFTETLGLFVSDEQDDRVYLRAWQDFDHHSLILTQAPTSGVEHVAWRVADAGALSAFERTLNEAGIGTHWVTGGAELGHGDALRFTTPAGLPFELFWEVERYVERDPAMRSRLASHPQRYTGKGVQPRRFDHVNFLVDEPRAEQEFLSQVLGIRHNYFAETADGSRLGSWLAATNASHEIALMRNRDQTGSLFHHVGYYVDSADEMIRAATLLADAGTKIEWGPGCHGTSGAIFLYCFEPSGNRVEVWTGGFLLVAPDWEPIRWDPEAADVALEMWGSKMPDTYLRYGTALAAGAPAAVPAA